MSRRCASLSSGRGRLDFGVVQLLPINEVGRDNSPYNAISAMAIEPTTLHLAPRFAGGTDAGGIRERDG